MDLTQLANLGEFIGGVAVLVTLVYLAVQVRQSTSIQKTTAKIAAGQALQESANRFSTFRQMIADESVGALWAKARRDEELSPTEAVRLRAVICELAYSAVATIQVYRATGNEAFVEPVVGVVAVELEGSERMGVAWEAMSNELRRFGFDELAADVAAQLARGVGHS